MATKKVNSDLLDSVQQDWKRERPDLDFSAMNVVGRIINLASHFKNNINQELKPFGLCYSDLDVLATLRRHGAPYQLTPTQLMQSVLLTSGAMTATLGRLETQGLVARKSDPDDGRAKSVVLTKAGFEIIEVTIEARFAEAQKTVLGLSEDDRKKLARLLRKLSISVG